MAGVTRKQAIQTVKQAEEVLVELLARALADHGINVEANALYRWIVHEASTIFEDITTNSVFAGQLDRTGFGPPQAALSAYLLLLCHLLWDYSIACRSDPSFTARLGQPFPDLAAEFGRLTGLDEMLHDVLESSERTYQSDGGGVDFRPVMDEQTFDFLQTLTDGRYGPSHLRDLSLVEKTAVAIAIYRRRLEGVKVLKRAWGLDNPVL